jgi:acetyl-CoA acyltransferase
MTNASAVIVETVRSPMGRGKPTGALSQLHPVELLAQILRALVHRTGIDPGRVDDVMVGCVTQVSEQSACVGRQAWLAAGFPESVAAVTVDRRCGSGQQAVHFAAQAVMSGTCDLVIAAGVESMSRVPILSNRQGADPFGPSVLERYAPGLVPQGVSAELVAHAAGVTREDMDAYAVRSHERAASASTSGIVLVRVPTPDGGEIEVSADETIRHTSSVDALAGLSPVFRTPEWEQRFPEITWGVTAANSSQLADGAAATLVASERMAAQLGLTPRARIAALAVAADNPVLMLTAPVPATRKALKAVSLSVDDIEHFEVNEAFASVPLAWQRELGADPARVNPAGGAIAFGHPLGASGVRLLDSMLAAMESADQRWGLQTMCEAGGMANAMVVERL